MANEKLLLLESQWRATPRSPPSEFRSAARLYASLDRLLPVSAEPARCRQAALRRTDWREQIKIFTGSEWNRRGPNLVVLSSHGWSPSAGSPLDGYWLAADDGLIDLDRELAELKGALKRSLVLLDACHLGDDPERLRASADALGVIGFQGRVNWLASSVFMLALLRRFLQAGVFQARRADMRRPRAVLRAMLDGEYARLAEQLGVQYSFRSSSTARANCPPTRTLSEIERSSG